MSARISCPSKASDTSCSKSRLLRGAFVATAPQMDWEVVAVAVEVVLVLPGGRFVSYRCP